MKERGILFTPANAQKSRDGLKWQTRRVLTPQPRSCRTISPAQSFTKIEIGDLFICPDMFPTELPPGPLKHVITECESVGTYHSMGVQQFIEKHGPKAHGIVGDRFWVREAWRTWEDPKTGIDGVRYKADNSFRPIEPTREAADKWIVAHDNGRHGDKWRHARFMFRWCSRTLLEITDVRVERLQDISEEDALAEGIDDAYLVKNHLAPPRRQAYFYLWDDINGVHAHKENPWVWALTFKKI